MQQHPNRRVFGTSQVLLSALTFSLGLLSASTAIADTRVTELESLSPTEEHRQATEVISHLMQQYH